MLILFSASFEAGRPKARANGRSLNYLWRRVPGGHDAVDDLGVFDDCWPAASRSQAQTGRRLPEPLGAQ